MLKIIIDYDDVLNDCNQAAVDRLNKEKKLDSFYLTSMTGGKPEHCSMKG